MRFTKQKMESSVIFISSSGTDNSNTQIKINKALKITKIMGNNICQTATKH